MKSHGIASTAAGTADAPGGPETPSTLDEIEGRLRAWVARVAPTAGVSLGGDRPAETLGVAFRLVGLGAHPEPRGVLRPPAQAWLRYLVTTWATEPGLADRLLVDLALDAAEHADLELDLDLPRLDQWNPQAAEPQPSFMVRLLISRPRAAPMTQPVLQALVIQSADAMRIAGVVLGPGDLPIPGAVLAVIGLNATTTTDVRGRFVIARAPRTSTPARLRVRAKGVDRVVEVPDDDAKAGAMVIRLDLMGRRNA